MLKSQAISGGATYGIYLLREGPGLWLGRGAGKLGLTGEVSIQQFEAVRLGGHPETGEYLRPRINRDRPYSHEFERDGKKFTYQRTSQARNLFDFVVSAPKTVSIMGEVDERIKTAHIIAATNLVREMEARYAAIDIRANRARETAVSPNLVAAVFHQQYSRRHDPQLHTHIVAANLNYDEQNSRWLTLNPTLIYKHRQELSELYWHDLKQNMELLGYRTYERVWKHRSLGFEIRGIPGEIRQEYSQGKRTMDRLSEELYSERNRPPTERRLVLKMREEREGKSYQPYEETRAHVLQRLSPESQQLLEKVRSRALKLSGLTEEEKQELFRRREQHYQQQFERWKPILSERAAPELIQAIQEKRITPYTASVIARVFDASEQMKIVNLPREERVQVLQEVRQEMSHRHGHKLRLRDGPDYEAPARKYRWYYGEQSGYGMKVG